MKSFSLLSFLTLLVSQLAFAQPANTNVSNGVFFDGEPYLTINPTNNQNLIAAWIGVKFLNGGFTTVIKTKASFNGGSTWSTENYLPHFAPTYGSADPTMAFSTTGIAYLAYIDHREAPDSGGVFVARSTNGGLNWDTPTLAIDMYDAPTEKPIDRPWMVIDKSLTSSNGTLYITSMPPSFISPPNRPYYKVSTDGGFTWSTLTNLDGPGYLTGGSIQQTMATPAVTKNGEFVALYPSYVASQNVFPAYYLAKSVDQGQTLTYSTVYTATAGTSNTNFKKGYLLITDPSNANKMVFLSPAAPNNESDIEATHSNDGGQTWSARIRVNDDAAGNGKAQDMVWGAYNETGKLVVTWRDRRNSAVNDFWGAGYDFYYATSSDNGQTFGQNQKLTSQFVAFDSLITNSGNDFMSCTYSGDTLYSVWGDTRNNKMNIYFAKTLVSLNTTIGVSHLNMDETNWSIFPNPVEDYINLSVDKSLIGDQIGIYNFDGKFIKQTEIQSTENQIDLNDLASGNYLIVVGESVKKFIKK
jgi:hypothetical protein